MTDERPRITRRQRPPMTLIDAIYDDALFAPWFDDLQTWEAWITFLRVLFAQRLNIDQQELYRQCTGRTEPPTTPHQEAWLICGRRSGKSFMLALIAVYVACFKDFRQHLAPGERATIAIIAADKRQARVIFRFLRALLREVPMLNALVERETADLFDLSTKVTIEVATTSFRTTRGYALACILLDELAFWPTDEDAASPDTAVIAALRPGMAQFGGDAMFLAASSPYARRGALWEAHRQHFAINDDPVLVWQAATRTMNPTVPQSFLDAEMQRDAASARSEYFALFRNDLEAFVRPEPVEACTPRGIFERAPQSGTSPIGFVDPSGGSQDSFGLGIAHNVTTKQLVQLDLIREWKPPFSPEEVCHEIADILKRYGITTISGDKYAGIWPVEMFGKVGITYEQNARPKAQLYQDLLPLINSQRCELLDHPKLISQLLSLERRTGSARDQIDHPPGQHDDLINSAAGAIVGAVSRYGAYDTSYKGWQDEDSSEPSDIVARVKERKAFQAQQLHGILQSVIIRNNIPFGGGFGNGRWS